LAESIQSWLAQPCPALLDVTVVPMQLVTPRFVAREAVHGMAVYSARAILHGQGHDVWEMVEENISQGKKARVQT
jgi:pyruvate dehydrogenase (quinone)